MSRSDRQEVLEGADFMVIFVAVDRKARCDRITSRTSSPGSGMTQGRIKRPSVTQTCGQWRPQGHHRPPRGCDRRGPVTLNRRGAHDQPISALPEPISVWCRREATVAKFAVQATLEMNRGVAKHTLILDPTTRNLTSLDPLFDAYLDAYEDKLGGRWE